MRRTVRVSLIVALCAAMAGCGFHLRGSGELPEGWKVIAVSDAAGKGLLNRGGDTWYDTGHEGMRRELVQSLSDAGFSVEAGAPVTIELLDASVRRRAASIDANASAAEYEIIYTVRYRIVGADGAQVVPESTIHADSSYRYNKTAVLGSAEQETIVYEDLRHELARRVVDQLRRQAAAHATAP